MQSPEPQAEHKWLERMVGEWTYEHECSMGPDQPPMKATGTESVRSIGSLWTMGEGKGTMPDGGPATTIMTLGYDPQSKRFVGTFIGSMMTHLWIYNGALDASGKVLTLDTEGPDFSGGSGLVAYQDIVEFVDDNHRALSSQLRGPDGKWQKFMTAQYRRKQ
jgi:Protein of unknown function (DUF1579)